MLVDLNLPSVVLIILLFYSGDTTLLLVIVYSLSSPAYFPSFYSFYAVSIYRADFLDVAKYLSLRSLAFFSDVLIL